MLQSLKDCDRSNQRPPFKGKDTLSYWSLGMFKQCPKQFECIIEKGIRLGYGDARAAIEGKALHLLVERCLLGRHESPWMRENSDKVLEECIKTEPLIRWKSDTDKQDVARNVKLMADYMVGYLTKVREELELYHIKVEKTFYVEILPGLILSGRPDIRLENKKTHNSIIWDLKAVSDEARVDVFQLKIYGLAAMVVTGRPVDKSVFITPKLGRDVPFEFTPEDYKAAMEEIDGIWERIKACRKSSFNPRESYKCKWCGVKEHCSGFVVEMDPRNVSL